MTSASLSRLAAEAVTAAAKAPDWERIELDYRAGVKTLRAIAEEHGITHGAVNKRAKARGWARDLATKIKAEAEARVSKAAVSKEVSTAREVSEREVVAANAEAITRVRLSQRADITKGRDIVAKLLAELEATTDNAALFAELGELMRRPDDAGRDRLNDIYQKVISTSGRINDLKGLAESMTKLVTLERQAWGLDEPTKPPGDTPEDLSDAELDAKINARLAAISAADGASVH